MPVYKMEYEYKDQPKSIIFDASYQEIRLSIKLRVVIVLFFLLSNTSQQSAQFL